MSTTTPTLEDLKRLADLAVDDVIEDAIKLLELRHRLKQTTPDSEAYEDLEIELETTITSLRIHAQSAEEAFEAVTDALPDD